MSFDCPDRQEAERRGREAARWGQGSWRNPYRDECPEAEESWERARRREEDRIEEDRRSEEDAERQAWESSARRADEDRAMDEAEYWAGVPEPAPSDESGPEESEPLAPGAPASQG